MAHNGATFTTMTEAGKILPLKDASGFHRVIASHHQCRLLYLQGHQSILPNPVLHSSHNDFIANMIADMTGSPLEVV
jgi:hypothetical protein